jgi:putative hydrolase of the HAD superfamily
MDSTTRSARRTARVIRTVFLDATGTLLALREPVGATYARFARREGIGAGAEALERAFRAAIALAEPLAFPGASPNEVRTLERRWWHHLMNETFRAAGVETSQRANERAFAALFEHFATRTAWRLFPDVRPALRRLRAADMRLAVVSNFDTRLVTLLEAFGVASSFDAIVLSSTSGFAKPDRRFFNAAVSATCSVAAATLHVGDSERLDRRAAIAAGLQAVRLDRGGKPTRHVIASLEELTERIRCAVPQRR